MDLTLARVSSNEKIAEGIYKMTINGEFQGKPGQFYMLKVPNSVVLLPRAISIFDVDDEKISFLYQVVGKGTAEFTTLRPEDEIQLTGPLGNGFDINQMGKKVAIVTGGIGIAPMMKVAKSLIAESVDVYSGFRNEVYGISDLKNHVDNVYISTEDGSRGHKGYVTEILEPEKYDIVLCCGPEVMMFAVAKLCKEKNTPVYISMENKMACGIGACLVCTCKTKGGNKRTCKEGPVFSGEEFDLNA